MVQTATAAATEQEIETVLWLQYQQTKETSTRNRLVMQYEGLVKSVALQVVRGNSAMRSIDDLISEGLIALIDAVERYDPSYQVNFKMFAYIKIRGAMLDFFRKETPGYKRRIAQKIRLMQEAKEHLTRENQREPTPEEVARHLGMTAEEYDKELSDIQSVKLVSLDEIDWQQDDEAEPADDGIFSDPGAYVGKKELEGVLAREIEQLNREQQLVLSLVYFKGLKINQVAEVLGMDSVRVSEIKYQAVKRLKRGMKKYIEEE